MQRADQGRVLVIGNDAASYRDCRRALDSTHDAALALLSAQPMPPPDDHANATVSDVEVDWVCRGDTGIEAVQRAVLQNRPYAMAFLDAIREPQKVPYIRRLWQADPRLCVVVAADPHDREWSTAAVDLQGSGRLTLLNEPMADTELRRCAGAAISYWQRERQVAG